MHTVIKSRASIIVPRFSFSNLHIAASSLDFKITWAYRNSGVK